MKSLFLSLCLLWSVAASCAAQNSTPPTSPLAAPPVDTERIRSVAEVTRWPHRRLLEADLNGDGVSERLIITSDVQVREDGLPLWEDGHRWAVYVANEGQPTLLYAAFVPNGHVEVAILNAGADGRRHVLLQERTPQQMRSLVVAYEGPGVARTVSAAHYQVERWLPGLVNP